VVLVRVAVLWCESGGVEMTEANIIERTVQNAIKKISQSSGAEGSSFNKLYNRIINSGDIQGRNLTSLQRWADFTVLLLCSSSPNIRHSLNQKWDSGLFEISQSE
jgi:hypothetical protein